MSKVFISKDELVDLGVDSKLIVEPTDIYAVLASMWFQIPYQFCMEYNYDGLNEEGKEKRNFIKRMLIKVVYNKSLNNLENSAYTYLCDQIPALNELKNISEHLSEDYMFNLPEFVDALVRGNNVPENQYLVYERAKEINDIKLTNICCN